MTIIGGYLIENRGGEQIGALGLGISAKTDGSHTRGAYSMFEYAVPAGVNGPPPHVHHREDESFLLLDGHLEVTVGETTYEMTHGDYLLLPRDVMHTFRNPSGNEARVISVVSPAGLENYYRALAEMPPGPIQLPLVKEIMKHYGIELLAPPVLA